MRSPLERADLMASPASTGGKLTKRPPHWRPHTGIPTLASPHWHPHTGIHRKWTLPKLAVGN